jgi:hypothetical protein
MESSFQNMVRNLGRFNVPRESTVPSPRSGFFRQGGGAGLPQPPLAPLDAERLLFEAVSPGRAVRR